MWFICRSSAKKSEQKNIFMEQVNVNCVWKIPWFSIDREFLMYSMYFSQYHIQQLVKCFRVSS